LLLATFTRCSNRPCGSAVIFAAATTAATPTSATTATCAVTIAFACGALGLFRTLRLFRTRLLLRLRARLRLGLALIAPRLCTVLTLRLALLTLLTVTSRFLILSLAVV
jgi:hypothetical protein